MLKDLTDKTLPDSQELADEVSPKQREVDISVGGEGEEARRTSMVLPYGAIFEILSCNVPGKIHKVKF